ncbi:glycosyltransferase [Vulgatibacter sp.]|uniref:glycosyltransferase n=1 Tax=Vulgatibacter sp. TaxID=1971226 RepID=UPI0035699199
MRVLFASDAAGFGGAEILAAQLAAALRGQGIDATFVAAQPDPRLRAHLGAVPLHEAPLRHKGSYRLRSLGAALDRSRVDAVARALERHRPDVVVINQPDPEDGLVLAAAGARCASTVGLLHLPQPLATLGVERLRTLRRLVARRSLRGLDRVVAVSAASAAEARAAWGVEATACPNGIPLPAPLREGERTEARRALGLGADERVIGALGRLDRQKGFADLLEAAAHLPPEVRVVIGGEGPSRAELEALRAARRLEGRVLLPGWMESRSLLAAADLLAMPSRFEGLPLALLEAGALGLDVVATPVGGIAEVLEASALVPVGDPAALARALAAALEGDGMRARRLEARVRSDHSIEAMAARFIALLRRSEN